MCYPREESFLMKLWTIYHGRGFLRISLKGSHSFLFALRLLLRFDFNSNVYFDMPREKLRTAPYVLCCIDFLFPQDTHCVRVHIADLNIGDDAHAAHTSSPSRCKPDLQRSFVSISTTYPYLQTLIRCVLGEGDRALLMIFRVFS